MELYLYLFNRPSIFITFSRVFFKYCVFSKILKYILGSDPVSACSVRGISHGPLDGRIGHPQTWQSSEAFREKHTINENPVDKYMNNRIIPAAKICTIY